MTKLRLAVASLAIVLLAACGGGGSAATPTTHTKFDSYNHALWMARCTDPKEGPTFTDEASGCQCLWDVALTDFSSYEKFIQSNDTSIMDTELQACSGN